MGNQKGNRVADRARAKHRAAAATELRLAGVDYDSIAEQLGYANRSGAWKAVQRCLSARMVRNADELRDQGLLDLALLQERSWPAAMAGDPRAVDRCLRALDQRARLLGLYDG